MVQPESGKWGQTQSDLRQLAVQSEHARTRARFQALSMIGRGQTVATEVGHPQETILKWSHRYNGQGPTGLI